jgi:hypothetical protein
MIILLSHGIKVDEIFIYGKLKIRKSYHSKAVYLCGNIFA